RSGPTAPISCRYARTSTKHDRFSLSPVQTSTSAARSGMKAESWGEPRRTARMHIVIIGAGIIGLAVAHKLLDQGRRVTLIDRGELSAASRGNAGIIAHVDIQPLASPGMILKAARWFIDPVGPLSVRANCIPRLAPWLTRFLLASLPSRIERSKHGIIPLQLMALPAWERLLSRLGLTREFNRHGMLYVFENTEAFEATKPGYREQLDLGIPLELIDGSVIR